jgi:hypothetical protein
MMQYTALAHQKRIGSYRTIGGLFRDCKQQAVEALLNERILRLMLRMLDKLAKHLNLDMDMAMEAIFADGTFGDWMMECLAIPNAGRPATAWQR